MRERTLRFDRQGSDPTCDVATVAACTKHSSHSLKLPRTGTSQRPDNQPDTLSRVRRFVRYRVCLPANQAAAFFKMSRSISSSRTLRRSFVISALSAVVRPSVRRPASRSSCFCQFMIVWRATWNSVASEFSYDRSGPAPRSYAGLRRIRTDLCHGRLFLCKTESVHVSGSTPNNTIDARLRDANNERKRN